MTPDQKCIQTFGGGQRAPQGTYVSQATGRVVRLGQTGPLPVGGPFQWLTSEAAPAPIAVPIREEHVQLPLLREPATRGAAFNSRRRTLTLSGV